MSKFDELFEQTLNENSDETISSPLEDGGDDGFNDATGEFPVDHDKEEQEEINLYDELKELSDKLNSIIDRLESIHDDGEEGIEDAAEAEQEASEESSPVKEESVKSAKKPSYVVKCNIKAAKGKGKKSSFKASNLGPNKSPKAPGSGTANKKGSGLF